VAEKQPVPAESEAKALVSIIIPTKNRSDSLNRLLASISRQDYPILEIIIVDDGSDVPVKVAAPNIGNLYLIRNEKSQGSSCARNQGIEKACGEFIVSLDDDVELNDRDTIARAVKLITEHDECSLIGFRQLQPDGQTHYMQPANTNRRCYTSIFFGYGFLFRRQAMIRVGKFDPYIAFGYEEAELSLRLAKAGYKVIYDPALTVIHHHDFRGRDSRRMNRLVLRNSILAALLHLPAWCIPPQIAARLVHFTRLTHADKGFDWKGIGWVLRELKGAASYIKANRQAMPLKTLLSFRRLNRSPIIIQ
jgi:GT2 family glycosyltransferase